MINEGVAVSVWAVLFFASVLLVLMGCSTGIDRFAPAPAGPFGAPADAKPQQPPRSAATDTGHPRRCTGGPECRREPAALLNDCISERCMLECAEGNPSKPRYCLGMRPPTPMSSAKAFEHCRNEGRC
jgi:hypothetical protein